MNNLLFNNKFTACHYKPVCTDKKYIVVHYQGSLADAEGTARYFAHTDRSVSSHFVVGNNVIYKCLDPDLVAWHIGHGNDKIKNRNAIGVDLIADKLNQKACRASDRDWFITADVWENGLNLIASLMTEYNIPLKHVVRHYDVTGKLCPRPFCGSDINEVYQRSGDEVWYLFKNNLRDLI